MNIGIIGFGTVGRAVKRLLESSSHNTFVYDRVLPEFNSEHHKEAVARCDATFISVPTPTLSTRQCDLREVLDALSWAASPVCLKSTVPPGTTARLCQSTGKQIVFSPEYIGESAAHPYKDTYCKELLVLGGERQVAAFFLAILQEVMGAETRYYLVDSVTAELAKYMENCFLATKLAFVLQFFRIAESLGVDFVRLREIWLSDSRIGRSHTLVLDQSGFGGKCLPKDLAALIGVMAEFGGAPLLESVEAFNGGFPRPIKE